jgi:hypothetical protein
MLAAGPGGGEERAGGQVVEAAHDAAAVLEEQIDGAGAKERDARADGARPALEILDTLAIGERGQRGADDQALPEGVEVGVLQALAQEGLAGQEQDEGRAAVEVELAEQAQLFEGGIREPMGFIQDQELGLGGGRQLGEQGGGGLRRRAAHGGAIAHGQASPQDQFSGLLSRASITYRAWKSRRSHLSPRDGADNSPGVVLSSPLLPP